MATQATLSLDAIGLTAMRRLVNPKQFDKDLQAGLRYARSTVKKVAAREIGSKYALTAARIKKDIKDPIYTNDSILVRFNRVPPTLRAYGGVPLTTRPTKTIGTGVPIGLKYRVFKGKGGTQKRPGVFWLRVGSTPYPGIPFKREGPNTITALYGPSIGSIFVGKSAFGEKIREVTTEAAQVQFIKGVERSMSRRKRGF